MSKFRIEYLPKLGAEVKMVAQGFDSIDSAEVYARTNMTTALYASISMGERRVKDLWRKVECYACLNGWRDGRKKLSDVPVFDSRPAFAIHLHEAHNVWPAEADGYAKMAFEEQPLIDNSEKYAHVKVKP